MVTLVEHARFELDRLGEDRTLSANLLAVIGAWAAFGHSGASHECAMDLLDRLLRRQPLTPLTANPNEWIDRSAMSGCPLWQNTRDGRAVSEDRGLTYILVDDPSDEPKVHRSMVPPGWVRALRERDGYAEDDAVEAVRAYLNAGPISDDDVQALGAMGPADRRKFFMTRWGRAGAPVASLLYESPTDPDEPGLYA